MLQHGAIHLEKDVLANMDMGIRINADNIRVVGRVVDLAETNSIAHERISFRVAIRKDVGRIKQLDVP
jgi:hypothetical protein